MDPPSSLTGKGLLQTVFSCGINSCACLIFWVFSCFFETYRCVRVSIAKAVCKVMYKRSNHRKNEDSEAF